ncbi:MAG: Shedu anti-phage system protein SduA domain-containing protein, partial [Myxococcales bacterium]
MTVATAPKVLLVEDTIATATDYLRLLQQRGFVTEHAVAARDALEKAASFRPDVVLLDLQIPAEKGSGVESVEHGFQTLDALLKADPFRPICVVTAHSNRELVRRAMERTHGGPFIFKDDPDLRRALPRAIDVALASPAYTMSKVVREFRALVDKSEPDEHVYRRFIHQHWKVILGSEYREVESPHTIDGGASIDLLAIRWDGFADLWELKRPSDPLFKSYNHHLHHSVECARAIGQI